MADFGTTVVPNPTFSSIPSSTSTPPTNLSTNIFNAEPKTLTWFTLHGMWKVVMGILAGNILITIAVLAGLILGVCGLNMTLLELRAVAGTLQERQQARAIAKLKRHETWMLCSLIIVSVALGESFPFLIQTLYPAGQVWMPILVSTLCLAVIGEILPQYIIPRRAVAWGYYCRSLIWGCMFFTVIISFPLAWLLDSFAGQRDQLDLFTKEELGVVIRHHQKSEKRGGDLGQDGTRIMLGALKLDGRKIGGEIAAVPEPKNSDHDLEKADLVVVEGMIVKWSAVKVIRIDEPVDEAFVKKVKAWSYSRIPVIGTTGKEHEGAHSETQQWSQGTRIHGFLHTKSLIGLNLKVPADPESPLLVKDLDLYPLPIVREDMSIYELLNLFQTGMSRMAVVVPYGTLTGNTGAVWTVTKRNNEQSAPDLEEYNKHTWGLDYLAAAKAAIEREADDKIEIPGIKSPKPIGIVTFEDIIDLVLQKTSRDEKDFYDRNTSSPPTKTRKAGDFPVNMAALVKSHSIAPEPQIQIRQVSQEPQRPLRAANNTLRRRKVTNERTTCANDGTGKGCNTRHTGLGALDGADESSSEARSDELKVKKIREERSHSSYTQNSCGGFHVDKSMDSAGNGNMLAADEVAELAAAALLDHPKFSYESMTMRSLPSRKHDSRSMSDELKQKFRHVSAAPKLPTIRRLTSFSKETSSSSEKQTSTDKQDPELVMPEPSKATEPRPSTYYERGFNSNASGYDIDESMEDFFDRAANQQEMEKAGETVTLDFSDDDEDREEDLTYLYDAFPVPLTRASPEISQVEYHSLAPIEEESQKKYDGFPIELLDGDDKENRTPKYISSTMPRTIGTTDFDIFENSREKRAHERESSFHDDRALLPSQRKPMQPDEGSVSGIRRTSLWF